MRTCSQQRKAKGHFGDRINPSRVTWGGKITPHGDLSSVVPLPVGRYMNAFVTLPKNYVFFTK